MLARRHQLQCGAAAPAVLALPQLGLVALPQLVLAAVCAQLQVAGQWQGLCCGAVALHHHLAASVVSRWSPGLTLELRADSPGLRVHLCPHLLADARHFLEEAQLERPGR